MPISTDTKIGKGVKIPYPELVNLYGCKIEAGAFVAPFVEIQKGARIGTKSRIGSHSFVCEGVHIGKGVLVGHGVMFINDKYTDGKGKKWILRKTFVGDKVKIGSNATILPVKIGKGSIIGAGAVVTRDVPRFSIVAGNPARVIGKLLKK